MFSQLNTLTRKLYIYRRRSLRFDLIAAFVVFLVAIPLCLGIAIASGTPLFSGILSGIIGGLVVGTLSGSAVSISGPAAGMVAVVVTAIAQLGDFNTFLLALILAGMLQIIMGCLRAGFIADYIPSNVIQGLLCAIGILLIVKQLPLAFTHSNNLLELKMHLLDTSEEGFSLKPLFNLAEHINQGAATISILSFAVLISFEKTTQTWLKAIPGTVVVVVLGVLLNELFVLTNSSLIQDTPQLVNIPHTENFTGLLQQLQMPNWSHWNNPNVYLYAVILAIVASLETLLNIQAGEKLDKKHRHCSTDRELMAQGVGNMVVGLIGGLPITSVVVRSSVNIQTGAKTKFSAILHGVFILLAIVFLPQALNKIPLSSLASVLIYTGYKLTRPQIYRDIFQQGLDRFIPFIATLISIVAIDLLAGIIIGLVVSLFFILKSNSQARLDIIKERNAHGVVSRLVLPQQITFLNKASLIAELNTIPNKSQLIIDARYSDYIDKEILELIKTFQHEKFPHRHIELHLIGFKDRYDIHNYIDFIHVTTYPVQAQLLPHDVLLLLQEGNQRLLEDRRVHRSVKNDIQQTAVSQHPIAVILGCIDSRVPVETIFDMSFGDLFCVRIAGNVVNDDILASIEYACHVVGAKLIVVLGHTYCGAISAACDGVKQGHITQLLTKIDPALAAETQTPADERNSHNKEFVHQVTQFNIANTLVRLYEDSPVLRQMYDNEQIGMVGAVYDVNTGMVEFKSFANEVSHLQHQTDLPFAKSLHDFLPID
jgi:carbonic anhydrase